MIMELLTEQRNVTGPLVFGFLRLVGVPARRQKALATTISDYCRRHELTLAAVYMERCSSTSSAFVGMLDALVVTRPYGIVIPAPSHLGPRNIAADRRSRLAAAGAQILLVRGAQSTATSGSAPAPATGGATS
ncbi:hypothetical protein [Streptomyces roseicoloratus]|uniref:hypothetical protein n=2 Tax=Streptomyces TaxID=1883 RepID=UPI001009AD48|nr:hypothetical protein [Streptomyces roseicoloratus]